MTKNWKLFFSSSFNSVFKLKVKIKLFESAGSLSAPERTKAKRKAEGPIDNTDPISCSRRPKHCLSLIRRFYVLISWEILLNSLYLIREYVIIHKQLCLLCHVANTNTEGASLFLIGLSNCICLSIPSYWCVMKSVWQCCPVLEDTASSWTQQLQPRSLDNSMCVVFCTLYSKWKSERRNQRNICYRWSSTEPIPDFISAVELQSKSPGGKI